MSLELELLLGARESSWEMSLGLVHRQAAWFIHVRGWFRAQDGKIAPSWAALGRFWSPGSSPGEMSLELELLLGARESSWEMSLGLDLCPVAWIISCLGLVTGL